MTDLSTSYLGLKLSAPLERELPDWLEEHEYHSERAGFRTSHKSHIGNRACAHQDSIRSALDSTSMHNVERRCLPASLIATGEAGREKARRERRRALILPREHGAWGLLLVPMATGAGVALHWASHIFPLVLFLIAALALFWLRTPLESLLGTSAIRAQTPEESHLLRWAIVALAGLAALALAPLLWAGKNADLWLLGATVAIAFITQAVLKKLGRRTRMLSEMVGTIGLTAAAPAAYYVITGEFNATAGALWLANILFAGDQIHYVQLRIHTAKVRGLRAKLASGWGFAIGQAVMTAIITLACMARLMPPLASLAFAPLLFRGWFYFIQEPAPFIVRRLGWSELKHATAFCGLLIATFTLAK